MGVLIPRIYDPVVSARIIPGVFTQDLLVILASLVMILLAISLQQQDYRKTILILVVLGFLFYTYGISAIEHGHTMLYPLYPAV